MWFYHYQMKKDQESEREAINDGDDDYYEELVGVNSQNLKKNNLVIKKIYQ